VAQGGPCARLRAILLAPIMVAALAPAVFLGRGGRSVSGCGPAARPQHTAPAPSRRQACLPVPQRMACQRLPSRWLRRRPGGRPARGCHGPSRQGQHPAHGSGRGG